MIIISHGYYEQPDYIVEESDVTEAVAQFNAHSEYTADMVEFKDDEDYTITITHTDAETGAETLVGTVYDIVQLEDWNTAQQAFEATADPDEDGNYPMFAPTLDGGDIVK